METFVDNVKEHRQTKEIPFVLREEQQRMRYAFMNLYFLFYTRNLILKTFFLVILFS